MKINFISFDFSAINTESIIITIVGVCIVFLSLAALYNLFALIPKIMKLELKFRRDKQGKASDKNIVDMQGEVAAAISTAIHLYLNELHDEESHILTIKRVSRTYSPWNSKIYGLNVFRKIDAK